MNEKAQKKAAKEFAERWKGKGYEKGQSQSFWIDLLEHVYGIENAVGFITFEDQVHLDHTSFIDGYIKDTKVMIEQKSLGKDLRKPIKQSDGSLLNPFQQAKRYVTELPLSQHPRWIVTCNFEEFLVYDMEKPNGEPEQIFLKDLAKDYYRLQFLVETGSEMLKKEMEISLKAGELVGKLYDAILKQYKEPDSPETLKSLNMLCVRLVFCLYAEDAGIFGTHEMFGRYLKQFQAKDVRKALIELFKVLDTKPEERDPYMDDDLAAFPYVNGGLFADENIEIPRFTDEIVNLLVNNASAGFDWSEISPTIFGAVFESTLNPETRRSGGMHYTSIENIHKVIDPLFLDELKAEFDEIMESKQVNIRKKKIEDFRDKLSTLTFLDPACGSGNFLTETYLSLRRLENKAIQALLGDEIMFADTSSASTIKVGIGQFYGIEINDYAVTVAKTALWIAESQMLHETEKIINKNLDFLPLKSYANIVEGNALRIDWESVVPKDKLNYIMGNPPFAGRRYRTIDQIKDVERFFDYKDIDYVACWYIKAAQIIKDTLIRVAFVSTNSIVQGEQVKPLWERMFNDFKNKIDFAYSTFIWDSESNSKAHVHCVIIGFSDKANKNKKVLYSNDTNRIVNNINGYLIDAPNVFLTNKSTPICPVPKMQNGNVPLDGDALKIEENDYELFKNCKYVKRLIGGTELINNKKRYVLWLVGVSPNEIRNNQIIKERVEKCRENRLGMRDKATRKLADTPTTFRDTNNPANFIALPMVSSERRRYIPMDFFNSDYIPTNQVQIIPNATIYHFGVLTSNVHMAWMRAVCGRLESRYRYSKDIVYNNFPWCTPTDEQKAKIEQTAQAILDARAKYPDCSLADLYDETTMPSELRKAHQANDKAVMQAYGFDYKTMTESECVAELMKMYQGLTEGK